MKKIILSLLIITSIFMVTACGEKKEENNKVDNNQLSEEDKELLKEMKIKDENNTMDFELDNVKYSFTYEGEKITGCTVTYTLEDNESAIAMYNALKAGNIPEDVKDFKYDKNKLIVEMKESAFKDEKTSNLKESYKKAQEIINEK